MTNRKSIIRDGIQKSIRDFADRLRKKRRRQERRMLTQSLETRQLLAGPELVGIQSNEGDLLRDFETLVTNTLPTSIPELSVAPRELVFRFDDNSNLDPLSLPGITITRAGTDGFFESASATSDLGTSGAALVEFRAGVSGVAGNGTTIRFATTDRGINGVPVVSTIDTSGLNVVITLNLNSNSARPTTVADLISAVNNTPTLRQQIDVQQISGASLTRIGTTVDPNRSLVLAGANAAQTFSDLGSGGAVRVRFNATQTGSDGAGVQVIVKQRAFGGQALPLVLVSGKAVEVQMNSTPGFETTVDQFLTALNSNAEASSLVTASLEFGPASTVIGNRAPSYSPLILSGASDSQIVPGYIGLGDSPHEVVFRFAETLPDDNYRIDIRASGTNGLRNEEGEYFNDGRSVTGQFKVNGGPKVLAVVPQPVTRAANGTLSAAPNVIEVHFDGGDVNPALLQRTDYYRLIYTRDTLTSADDFELLPRSATYNSLTRVVRLEFPSALSRVIDPLGNGSQFIAGATRLRIGSSEPVKITPTSIPITVDPSDSFATAFNLNSNSNQNWVISGNSNAGIQSARLSSTIENTTDFLLNLPGGDVPGTRNLRPDDPSRLSRTIPLDILRQGADSTPGITQFQYNFVNSWFGDDPNRAGIDEAREYFNLITEQQKARVREVLSLFSEYLGVQFIETDGGLTSQAAFSIAVGELYGADPRLNSATAIIGANGTVDLNRPESVVVAQRDRNLDGVNDLVVLDFQDFDQSTDDQLGGKFFRGAFLAVGQLLGYGYADNLPQPVTQSTASVLNPGNDNEPAFPSVADIVNGQYLYRPESSDIDLYQFTLSQPGQISIETIAQRLSSASTLDTALRLYQRDTITGRFVEVAANDDYFSDDSLIETHLEPGTYAIGVSASGNISYDPSISGTGFGGRTEGEYELSLSFRASGADGIRDFSGNALDGDLDGTPGGLFDFWFVPNDPNTTLFVDKAAPAPDLIRSTPNPYANLKDALAAALPGDTIRVVGNGGADGDLSTLSDNLAYQIGRDNRGIALPDGDTFVVPKGVNVVIDAGAVFKMRSSRIGVGSTAPLVDRSQSSLQILGTPTLIDANGRIRVDGDGIAIPGSVIITSFNDDLNPNQPDSANKGDWGGIDFRGDIDSADESRVNLEKQGIFLNHIQYADLRYGGGQVSIDGRQGVVSPIDMAVTRPTILNNSITLSADAAMSATPDTFLESHFNETQVGTALFTPDYNRIGPHIRGNYLVDNTINGLFVRVTTRTGDQLQPLNVNARFDDTDIVHVLTENLQIAGQAGGLVQTVNAPITLLVRLAARDAAGELLEGSVIAGTYRYKLTFIDSTGIESDASQATGPITLEEDGGVELTQLPTVPANSSFSSRRLYRSQIQEDGTEGPYNLIATLNASDTAFIDSLVAGTTGLQENTGARKARLDAGLSIAPGTIIKLDGARIEATFGAHFYAEGTAERPVVMTSLVDTRYGAGGTFDTSSTNTTSTLGHGDWAGIYIGFGAEASIDHAVIAGGGGAARIPGGFASFNTIEVHQAELRLANSRLEMNDDGRGVDSPTDIDRGGRSDNAAGTLFIRASQPTIVNNTFLDGYGPIASFDINSFSFHENDDSGRKTGRIDSVASAGNSGPLIEGNRIAQAPQNTVSSNFGLNGLEIRGGAVATEVVLDDVDMVHIIRDTIEIPNQFIYGGMRLESDARGSLVVKFDGPTAGIVAGGNLQTSEEQFQDIADRIGGSLQVVGHPDFPVVLTALVDDTIGAGFRPDGLPSVDTNNNGIRTTILSSEVTSTATPPGLPVGQEYDRTDREVNNGTRIDNDIDPFVVGFFETTVTNAADIANISVTGINTATVARLQQQNYAFLAATFVDIDYSPLPGCGRDVNPFRLSTSTITRPAQFVSPDRVISEGTFNMIGTNANGTRPVNWVAETFILDNRAVAYSTIEFFTPDNRDFGDACIQDVHAIRYLDADAGPAAQDTLYLVGTPGETDFRAQVINGANRVGFSHGAFYANDGTYQLNAEYEGWMADGAPRLLTAITTGNTNYTVAGDIDQSLILQPNDPLFPNATAAYGIADIGTSFSWSLEMNQDRARITDFIEWVASDPANPFEVQLPLNIEGSGDWDGITIREAADDRNVYSTGENEPRNIGLTDVNPTPGQAQFLGELAPNLQSGDENRRLGFIVDASISQPSDIDVFAFIGEAGTQVWLDIDRADMSLDSVIELIDANGNTFVLSDDSMAESLGTKSRLVAPNGLFPVANARSLNLIAPNDPNITPQDHQDLYSTNPRDAGMRVVLPGEAGQRNIYHVRVRSSNIATGSNQSLLVSGQNENSTPTSLRRGLTSGAYQLQIRLQEVDEHAGTQIRYGDVRFAVNGVQVLGGPIHSPLAGDEYEVDTPNETLGAAQRLGLYSVDIDNENVPLLDAAGNPVLDAAGNPILVPARNNGPLSSDRLSKSVGGVLSGLTDVDWYQFSIQYESLTRDNAALYLATAFDLDYADGLARSDTAIYVFDDAGQLVLIGTDSNIADDQPLGTAKANDLSRGSFGTGDPFIGSAELSEGIYYIAVSNQERVPQPLDQFFNATSTNPLLRLEPIDSVRRIAEERFETVPTYSGTFDDPVVPVLFDQNSIVDYTFDDVLLYMNTSTGLYIVNPFTGQTYGSRTIDDGRLGGFGDEIRDIAFGSNGELFAYTGYGNRPPADNAWAYYSIDTGTGALGAPISVGGGMTTHHLTDPPPAGNTLDVRSDDGIEVEAITIREFRDVESGFFVGNRPVPRNGLAYTSNILYGFDETNGLVTGPTFNLDRNIPGAGTSRREIGQIDTELPPGARPLQLGFTNATETNALGISVPSLFDGDRFTLTNETQTVTFEFDQGYTLIVDDTPLADENGELGDPRTIPLGDTILVKLPGQNAKVFQFVADPADVVGTNIPIVLSANLGPEAVTARIAAVLRSQGIAVSTKGTQIAIPTAETVSIQTDPFTTSTSLSLVGEPGVETGSVRIPLFPTDTSGVIAQRIITAIDLANSEGDLSGVSAFVEAGATNPRSVRLLGGFIGAPTGSAPILPTGNLIAGGIPTGGIVTGIELVNDDLYAVTDTGGLFVVRNNELQPTGNRTVGTYVGSATDLVGLEFTGLRAGPASVQDGELQQLLFGVTSAGVIYAFNTRGELQPVFAGGRSSISTGIDGALGLDFSILDYNLWHVTERQFLDDQHGVGELFNGTRQTVGGGNSLAFNFENIAQFQQNYAHPAEVPNGARLDGTFINNTYNMPGGAKGEVLSNTFDLSGYAGSDLPTLYFSYFLDTDNVDNINGARDSLRVYIIDENGVEHLVASNSDARGAGDSQTNLSDDEFDDPSRNSPIYGTLYDDDIDVDVQQLFDNSGSWRQARVPLKPFAGQSGLSMRIEFSTAGRTSTGTSSLRTVAGDVLIENSQIVVNGETFAIDLAPAVVAPSGRDLANVYDADPAAVAVITVDGQQYVLDDGIRTIASNQIRIDLLSSQPAGTTLNDLSATTIAGLIADTVDLKRLVPTGIELETRYLDPEYRELIKYAGQVYVLNDGTRPVAVDEVNVPLIDPLSGTTLGELSQLEIAAAFSLAAGLPLPQYNVTENFMFSDPTDVPGGTGDRNDLLFQATQLPYNGGNTTIRGTGRIGSVDILGVPSNLNDVDLVKVDVAAGTTILVDVDLVTNPILNAAVRFFDSQGNELPSFTDVIRDTVQITATKSETIYIGISGLGNETYDPRIAGTAITGQIDSYVASVTLLTTTAARTEGSLIEVDGTATITTSSATLLPTRGQDPIVGLPISVSRFDTASEVASAVSRALANRFNDGDIAYVPSAGATVRTAGLTIDDFGPFVNDQLRYGDSFSAGFLPGAVDNNHQGVFIDDIIIGFAERGEIATNSRAVGPGETFVEDGTRFFTSTPRPTQPTVTGAYQLEIRDASEYVNSDLSSRFQTFDTNDRLTTGYGLTAYSGFDLVDGATFTIASAGAELRFEFDILDAFGVSNGLNSPSSQILIPVNATDSAAQVGTKVLNALNAPAVRQLLNVEATGANGSTVDSRLNIYGDVTITDRGTAFQSINAFGFRGDANRERSDQGVIIIENSRFLFNADAGIELNRGAESRVQGVDAADARPAAVVYPRNLVELNTNDLLPGVVIQSNVLAFNSNAGVRITGLGPDGGTQSNAVAFDRVLNNTIVGGNVNRAADAFPDVFNGILFDKGGISFADVAVSFIPGANVSTGFDTALAALGAPVVVGRGLEPIDGEFTTSLGRRGELTLGFTNNYLTGSGDARPDLVIFETGSIEGVAVSISRDGVNFISVGVVAGIDATIDLDAFGFNAQDRFGFVRLVDLGQGTGTTGPVGADIDAVGALSTVAADVYIPGSQGIVVQEGAAPTLLNNVLANMQTAIAVDASSSQTVIDATTYYRNATNARNSQVNSLGLHPQLLLDVQEIFIDPIQLRFTPRAGTPIIDASTDSLEDRPSLITVKGAIGLPPSPIIAPRLDVNGQLRVDDPQVEFNGGTGENVFKDRGAEDRADQVGPRAVLVSPRAPDIGIDGGQVVTGRGTIFDAFDIQLIDGIAPADPIPGVGIDDDSVTGNAILVTRDGFTLIEGIDYRFGYDPSNNIIRLTPLAGVWQQDSVYVIRLLDSSDAVVQVRTGAEYNDGDLTTVIGLDGSFTTLEADTGINIVVAPTLFGDDIDGQAITVFDGVNQVTFEFDTDGVVTGSGTGLNDTVGVAVASTLNVEQLTEALVAAINGSILNLTARSFENRIQLLEGSTLSSATPVTDAFSVTVTNTTFTLTSALFGVADGEIVTVSDGVTTFNFEFNTNNLLTGVNTITVPIFLTDSPSQMAVALNNAIALSGLNVTSSVLNNRVIVLADSPLASGATLSEFINVTTAITGPSIGTAEGFGLQVPNELSALDPDLADGETFVIQRGANLIRTFELDFGDGTTTVGAIPVLIGNNLTIDGVADALVNAIAGAGLGLNPQNIGEGRVTLGGDANYAIDLTNTTLGLLSSAGQRATVPVVIPIDATANEVAELYRAAILSIGLQGATVATVGNRLIIDGIGTVSGTGAVSQPIVRDDVGNLLQSNTVDGTTELIVFVGGGADYGDAPSLYLSRAVDGGPSHNVIDNLYLGRGVTPDADAQVSDRDRLDDGVRFSGALRPGFSTQLVVDINLPSDTDLVAPIAAPGVFYLDAWFDWNGNGRFEDTEVQRFGSNGSGRTLVGVGAGNSLQINVPPTAVVGDTYARFRISEDPSLLSTGFATSGEVEDYKIFVSSNPFRNPSTANRNDVNNSGVVTPLDALQIINSLNRAGASLIRLSEVNPTTLPTFPDTNSDGVMTVADALNVINELNLNRNTNRILGEQIGEQASGEQISTSFVPTSNSVYASGATFAYDYLLGETGEPIASSEETSVVAQQSSPSRANVYDPFSVQSIDSIVDLLAEDASSAKEETGEKSILDQVFANLD